MSRTTSVVRLVSGVAVGALVVGVVGLGLQLPSPATDDVLSAGAVVDVPPSPTRLVCPGPLVLPEQRESDADFDPVPVDPLTSLVAVATSSGGGAVLDLAGAVTVARLTEGVDTSLVREAGGAAVVEAEPTDEPAVVGAASSALVTAGDLRGLARRRARRRRPMRGSSAAPPSSVPPRCSCCRTPARRRPWCTSTSSGPRARSTSTPSSTS